MEADRKPARRALLAVTTVALIFAGMLLTAVAAAIDSQTQSIPETPVVAWVSPLGGYYHLPSCPNGKEMRFVQIPLWEAVERNLKACPVCEPQDDPKIKQATANDLHKAMKTRDLAAVQRKNAEAARLAEVARAQPLALLVESRVRQIAQSQESIAKNDPDAFRLGFRRLVNSDVKTDKASEYSGPFALHLTDELYILVAGPVGKFESAFAERVRKFESTAGIPWSPNITVTVIPRQISAPNVSKIVLQLKGATVAALSSTLKPALLQTRMNAREMIHQGEVTFPASAFQPAIGIDLKLIAVPEVGTNIIHKFTNAELRSIR